MKSRGRPRIYGSAAERTAAYRKRRKINPVTVDVPEEYRSLVLTFAKRIRAHHQNRSSHTWTEPMADLSIYASAVGPGWQHTFKTESQHFTRRYSTIKFHNFQRFVRWTVRSPKDRSIIASGKTTRLAGALAMIESVEKFYSFETRDPLGGYYKKRTW